MADGLIDFSKISNDGAISDSAERRKFIDAFASALGTTSKKYGSAMQGVQIGNVKYKDINAAYDEAKYEYTYNLNPENEKVKEAVIFLTNKGISEDDAYRILRASIQNAGNETGKEGFLVLSQGDLKSYFKETPFNDSAFEFFTSKAGTPTTYPAGKPGTENAKKLKAASEEYANGGPQKTLVASLESKPNDKLTNISDAQINFIRMALGKNDELYKDLFKSENVKQLTFDELSQQIAAVDARVKVLDEYKAKQPMPSGPAQEALRNLAKAKEANGEYNFDKDELRTIAEDGIRNNEKGQKILDMVKPGTKLVDIKFPNGNPASLESVVSGIASNTTSAKRLEDVKKAFPDISGVESPQYKLFKTLSDKGVDGAILDKLANTSSGITSNEELLRVLKALDKKNLINAGPPETLKPGLSVNSGDVVTLSRLPGLIENAERAQTVQAGAGVINVSAMDKFLKYYGLDETAGNFGGLLGADNDRGRVRNALGSAEVRNAAGAVIGYDLAKFVNVLNQNIVKGGKYVDSDAKRIDASRNASIEEWEVKTAIEAYIKSRADRIADEGERKSVVAGLRKDFGLQ